MQTFTSSCNLLTLKKNIPNIEFNIHTSELKTKENMSYYTRSQYVTKNNEAAERAAKEKVCMPGMASTKLLLGNRDKRSKWGTSFSKVPLI